MTGTKWGWCSQGRCDGGALQTECRQFIILKLEKCSQVTSGSKGGGVAREVVIYTDWSCQDHLVPLNMLGAPSQPTLIFQLDIFNLPTIRKIKIITWNGSISTYIYNNLNLYVHKIMRVLARISSTKLRWRFILLLKRGIYIITDSIFSEFQDENVKYLRNKTWQCQRQVKKGQICGVFT